MDGLDNSSVRAFWCFSLSLAATILGVVILPGYMLGGGWILFRWPARTFGLLIAAVCVAAFLQCPRRQVVGKVSTLLLLVPGAFIGVLCLADFVFAIQSRNTVVAEYVWVCQRFHLC